MDPGVTASLPAWAQWAASEQAFTVGIEEEVMLLVPDSWVLAGAIDEVLPRVPPEVRASAETQSSALEYATGVHERIDTAVAELRRLRGAVRETTDECGLGVAAAGTHPFAVWREVAVTAGERQEEVYGSMRELTRREPTFALHVHVGVPDPEDAVRVFNAMRIHAPTLLALSANSPYWQGRDTGLASARTPLFQGFPRVGVPRAFASYGQWVQAIDLLVRCEAFPDPELPVVGRAPQAVDRHDRDARDGRADDGRAQRRARRADPVARAPRGARGPRGAPRDRRAGGAGREPLPGGARRRRGAADRPRRRVPPAAAQSLPDLLEACRPHARDLGCEAELDHVAELLDAPGNREQLRIGGAHDDGLRGLVGELAAAY